MQAKYHIKVLCVILFCAFAWRSRVEAVTDFGIPFKYKNTTNETEIVWTGTYPFVNASYSATEDCPTHHRTPDGQQYEHGHSWEAFGNFAVQNPDTGNMDLVTAEKSDWAWDAFYGVGVCANVSRYSGSTFLKNCYSYATDAPTPMPFDGWISWTVESEQCELTVKKKSNKKYGADHCIVISSIDMSEGSTPPCVVTSTSEKNASSGVYNISYFGMGNTGSVSGPVRKRK